MIIKLSPQRRDETLVVIKKGMTLNVNGEDFDFSPMGDGDTLPREAINSMWFIRDVEKENGVLTVTFLFPNPWNYSDAQAFPVDLIDVPDGLVRFPPPLTPEETAIKFPPRLVESEEEQEAQHGEVEA